MRDRAILMLFIGYGLRAGEVGGLQLDDLDWENGTAPGPLPQNPAEPICGRCSVGVGYAILRYVREARPSGFGRRLFFTTHAPDPAARPKNPRARWSATAWRASTSSPAGAVHSRPCGMPRLSICWIRACRRR